MLSHLNKPIIILLFACMLFTFFQEKASAATTLTTGAAAFFDLNEPSGSRVDSVGGNVATEESGAVGSTTGKIGTAAVFDGTTSNLTIPDNASLSTGDIDFTIAGWVYLTSKVGTEGLFGKFLAIGDQREYLVYFDTATDRFRVSVSGDGTNPSLKQLSAGNFGSPSLNTWYFVVAWHDSVNNTLNIQVNNGTANSTAWTGGVFDGGAPFTIGGYVGNNASNHNRMIGRVDGVGLWKKVLSAGERTELYNSGNGIESPYASPSVPTGLSGTVNAPGSSVTLNWTAPASDANYDYIIEYKQTSDVSWLTFSDGISSAKTANVTGLTNGTSYDFRVSAVNTNGTSAASTLTSTTPSILNTLSITTPVTYQVFQRNSSNQANIVITGTYTGSPTAIEASFNGGAYQTIASGLTGASTGLPYSGTLTNQVGGQGTLTVRFTNDTPANTTKTYIGVGDIYVIAGQSNAEGKGFNNQVYSTSGPKAILFGNDDVWKDLVDPTDSPTNQVDAVSRDSSPAGSVWPLLATYILADQNVPVAFIPTALSATSISVWQPNASNHGDTSTLYGSMYRRINAVGGSVKAVLWFQGEADADEITGLTQSQYTNYLNTYINSIYADFSVPVVVGQIGNNNKPAANTDAIRTAQRMMWSTNAHALAGPVTADVNLADEGGDNLHFKSDADLQVFARRWWAVLKGHFYGGTEDPRGPRITSVMYTTPARDTIRLTFTSTTAPVLLTSQIVSPSVFGLTNDGAAVAISTATITSSSEIELSVTPTSSGVLALSYASGMTGASGTVPVSSGTYNLPAEPFSNYSVVAIDTTAPEISSIGLAPNTYPVNVMWTTNEIASSSVEYGVTTAYGTTTSETDTSPRVLQHSITIPNLSGCATYYYRVISVDAFLNEVRSPNQTFTTPGCGTGGHPILSTSSQTFAPVISNTQVPTCLPGDRFNVSTGLSCTTPANSSALVFIRILKLGTKGDDVRALQEYLISKGFTLSANTKAIGNDGIFGKLTLSAVRSFQESHNLVVDGKVGPKTIEAMNK